MNQKRKIDTEYDFDLRFHVSSVSELETLHIFIELSILLPLNFIELPRIAKTKSFLFLAFVQLKDSFNFDRSTSFSQCCYCQYYLL